jgi:hypothetical protein
MFGRLFNAAMNDLASGRPLFHRERSYSEPDPEPQNQEGPEVSNSPETTDCLACGGMGRSGGEASYSTIGDSCTVCSGTGKSHP